MIMRSIVVIAISLFICSVHAISTPTTDDMNTLTSRRIERISQDNAANSTTTLNKWKATFQSNGTWSDINMTSGCGSRIANWPAIEHLARALSFAVSYTKTLSDTMLQNSLSALDYWFENDFTEHDCIENGGVATKNCPCGTPGLWNKNWYNQLIAIPRLVGNTCLLLRDQLSEDQTKSCITIQSRAFAKVTSLTQAISSLTGANLLDVSNVGVTLSLFKKDTDLLKTALDAFYDGVSISKTVAGDGIQADGSFIQHAGILYNANYGKDYINDVLAVFTETLDTNIGPSDSALEAFKTLMSGTEWMIVADTKLKQILWQYSAMGRMVSFKYADKQSSGGVAIDLDKIKQSAKGADTEEQMAEITDRLKAPSTEDANQGNLVGTRYFYNSDYMVHRTPDYVTTFKMYSSRTINSECLNVQNSLGFHLSDGALYNYLSGDEYLDTFSGWSWELVPGTTVDIEGTPLKCSTVKNKGKKKFVGGATDENMGIAVMDYLNPINGNLAFKKTVFFFPSGYAIQIGPTISKNTTAQLVTVLDQRRRNGDIYVSGKLRNTLTTYSVPDTNYIWHDSIGYYFPTAEEVYVDSKPRYSDWSAIGISEGIDPQQLWTSYIKHPKRNTTGLLTQYIVQPGISESTFNSNAADGKVPISLAFHASSPQVNAAYSSADKTIAAAFWTAGSYQTPWESTTIQTDKPCVVLIHQIDTNKYRITVAEPTQSLASVKLTLTIGNTTQTATFTLPTENMAGSTVVKTLTF
ncbi:chondroitin AC/alginate lyase [Gilbertella persicaria]|uniref:chondroitin AC/alginate lyase n=1 Tax=Gilbertella persicaria TaxID=101096 RepID=UPI00221FCDA8|nr:chondroitin AC/alginate lyase [Gilbertella persicaria]KAI8060631.1 chondroitin AC/alginate lyase [Gilbertella persicaria]